MFSLILIGNSNASLTLSPQDLRESKDYENDTKHLKSLFYFLCRRTIRDYLAVREAEETIGVTWVAVTPLLTWVLFCCHITSCSLNRSKKSDSRRREDRRSSGGESSSCMGIGRKRLKEGLFLALLSCHVLWQERRLKGHTTQTTCML